LIHFCHMSITQLWITAFEKNNDAPKQDLVQQG